MIRFAEQTAKHMIMSAKQAVMELEYNIMAGAKAADSKIALGDTSGKGKLINV
jgi:hypothetical protein